METNPNNRRPLDVQVVYVCGEPHETGRNCADKKGHEGDHVFLTDTRHALVATRWATR